MIHVYNYLVAITNYELNVKQFVDDKYNKVNYKVYKVLVRE